MKIINTTRGTTLLQNGEMADTFGKRGKGLLGRKGLEPDGGLVIIPNNSVHSFFMRFPIDVVFVSKDHQVLHFYPNMKAWRISRIVFKAHYVVELPVGQIAASATQVGDKLEWEG